MNSSEIVREIVSGKFGNSELDSIVQAVIFARNQLTKQAVGSFLPGDSVKFTSTRNNRVYTGKVRKVNRKYVMVDVGVTTYRVPGNMLEYV